MNVISIYENCHGVIAIAANMRAAIRFLVEEKWIEPNTEFLDDPFDMYNDRVAHLSDKMGKNESTEEEMVEFLLKQNEDFFEDTFYFTKMEVLE